MKHLGIEKLKHCQCRCCVGNKDSKPIRKAVKHSGRHRMKLETKDALQLTDKRGKTRVR
jgi:hypothetical protein